MSKTGFLYTCAGLLKDADGTYEKGRHLGTAATFNITPTANDVKDHGDNRVTETDTSVTGGTVSLELNDMEQELQAFLLGHKIGETNGEVTANVDDIAPLVILGAIGTSIVNKKNKYIAKAYRNVQFKEPNDENATKQDTTNFTHTTLEGNIIIPEDGNWKSSAEFDTYETAKTWLEKKCGFGTETV